MFFTKQITKFKFGVFFYSINSFNDHFANLVGVLFKIGPFIGAWLLSAFFDPFLPL